MEVHEQKFVSRMQTCSQPEASMMTAFSAMPGVNDLPVHLALLNEALIVAQTSAQRRGQLIGMMLGFLVIAAIGYAILKLRKPPK